MVRSPLNPLDRGMRCAAFANVGSKPRSTAIDRMPDNVCHLLYLEPSSYATICAYILSAVTPTSPQQGPTQMSPIRTRGRRYRAGLSSRCASVNVHPSQKLVSCYRWVWRCNALMHPPRYCRRSLICPPTARMLVSLDKRTNRA